LARPTTEPCPRTLGIIKKALNAKVAVYTCGIDISQTETKGTVLLKNAEEMLNFTTGEEDHMEKVSFVHHLI
jgi:T-complex protein 1 subunit theta